MHSLCEFIITLLSSFPDKNSSSTTNQIYKSLHVFSVQTGVKMDGTLCSSSATRIRQKWQALHEGKSPFCHFYGRLSVQFSSVAQSCLTLQPHGLQHARIPHPSPTPRACSNSCPSSWWCHSTISSSVVLFSSCLQGQGLSIRVFSNESVLRIRWPKYWNFSSSISPSNEYSGFPLGWTGLISLLSKALSRVSPTPQFKSIISIKYIWLWDRLKENQEIILVLRKVIDYLEHVGEHTNTSLLLKMGHQLQI